MRSHRSAFFLIGLVFLLCRCAAKHQPVPFSPYFPERSRETVSPQQLEEVHALEGENDLSPLKRRRLLDLYLIELKQLKPGTPRHVEVKNFVSKLQDSLSDENKGLEELSREVRKLRADNLVSNDPPRIRLRDRSIKKAYDRALHLWNDDEGPNALKVVDKTLDWALKGSHRKEDVFKLLTLKTRISIEQLDFKTADGTYHEAKEMLDCAPETADLGFLLALSHFAQGDSKTAIALFEGQCDPDKSPSNQLKRNYWNARFRDVGSDDKGKLYEPILKTPIPGYYYFLAQVRLGGKFELPPQEIDFPSYFKSELSVSGKVKDLISSAEERLRLNLRKEAELFLLKADYLLRESLGDDSARALLYVAHLLQAAGSPLESMRVYSTVTTYLLDDEKAATAIPVDFLKEMFPRPHAPIVESVCKQWDMDPDFVYAIMRQESAFHPGAVSISDARGLMQLLPRLARSLAHQWRYDSYYMDRNLFVAAENIKLAVFHLHELQPKAPHPALVAAAYNAGLERVTGWWKRGGLLPLDVFIEMIPVTETRNYVKLVLRNYLIYKALGNGGSLDPAIIPFQLPLRRVNSLDVRGCSAPRQEQALFFHLERHNEVLLPGVAQANDGHFDTQ